MAAMIPLVGQPCHVFTTRAKNLSDPASYPHHQSISALWNTKWRPLCARGIYPFVEGKLEDFEPIFKELITLSSDNTSYLYDPESYARPFFPVAERLVDEARKAQGSGDTASARDLYLRAAAVWRISRFPIARSDLGKKAWEEGKKAYIAGAQYLDPPNQTVSIPFTHLDISKGDNYNEIQAFLRIPKGTPPKNGWPVILFICGLDAYRTDNGDRTQAHADAGFAVLSIEIPGTGDNPASRSDPASPDRIMSSVLDWMQSPSATSLYHFDPARIIARGISTGGYYSLRASFTHGSRLFASVCQGAGAHFMFRPEWKAHQNDMEYPFALADAIAYKFDYPSLEAYIADDKDQYSLLRPEILGLPSCRTLLINGMEDSIFPIDDSIAVGMHGHGKDLVLRGDLGHMGNPGAEQMILEWASKVVRDAGTD